MTLRVLTLNIWNDDGPWEARLPLIRAWIARLGPDLIGLQEVLRGPGTDQLAAIAQGSGYHLDYAEASRFWRDESLAFGNAVLSRWPIVARHERLLPGPGDLELRSALTVLVDAPFGRVSFTNTHLAWRLHHSEVRQRQVVALFDQALKLRPRGGFPPIVVGDFNAEPDSDEIRYATGLHTLLGRSVHFRDAYEQVRRRKGDADAGYTWNNDNPHAAQVREPDRRIDYLFAGYPPRDGLGHITDCRLVCNEPEAGVWPSDHLGVYAELQILSSTKG